MGAQRVHGRVRLLLLVALAALAALAVTAHAFRPLPTYCDSRSRQCLCEPSSCELEALVRGDFTMSGYAVFVQPFITPADGLGASVTTTLFPIACAAHMAAGATEHVWTLNTTLEIRAELTTVTSVCNDMMFAVQLPLDADGSIDGNDALGVRNVIVVSTPGVALTRVAVAVVANATRPISAAINVTYAYDVTRGVYGSNSFASGTLEALIFGPAASGLVIGRAFDAANPTASPPFDVTDATIWVECALLATGAPCAIAWRTVGVPNDTLVGGGSAVFVPALPPLADTPLSPAATPRSAWHASGGVTDLDVLAPGWLLYPGTVAVAPVAEARAVRTTGSTVLYVVIGVLGALVGVLAIVLCCTRGRATHRDQARANRNERALTAHTRTLVRTQIAAGTVAPASDVDSGSDSGSESDSDR